jgi:antitoxin component YwqK of YwqJK toxin-antitoxin module
MKLKFGLLLVCVCISVVAGAQGIFDKQLPKRTYDTTIVDSVYGITIYEKLNAVLDGDSVRKCGVYACQNWQIDEYTTGQMLHKGFYLDGQLRSYKNYYPNGNLEREFVAADNFNSFVKLYYPNGQLKSSIKYKDGQPKDWIDYYQDGKVMYEEKTNNKQEYYLYQKYYYESGAPEKIMEIKDKKTMIFTYVEYYADGKVKLMGEKIFEGGQYVNHGEWKYFDAKGAQAKAEKWDHGTKIA